MDWFSTFYLPLAQASSWDEAPPPPPEPQARRPMSFSDLQQSIRDYNAGHTSDTAFRNGMLSLLAVIAFVFLVVHLYRRHKHAAPPDNLHRLGRELGRLVPFPLGARLLLKWVARATNTPVASLLLSAGLFDKCVRQWAQMPTFSMARHWGRGQLDKLRLVLFE
jgi:hypothetical protein